MAAERAIVATTVGGVPETVEDGVSAVLVPPRDLGQLKAALSSLSTDRDRRARLAHAAFEALRRFSPEAYRDRILTLYREVTVPS
jgi:glycosyltransferase involved in cell wall biosynthesis